MSGVAAGMVAELGAGCGVVGAWCGGAGTRKAAAHNGQQAAAPAMASVAALQPPQAGQATTNSRPFAKAVMPMAASLAE
jgi:hypothetical protein